MTRHDARRDRLVRTIGWARSIERHLAAITLALAASMSFETGCHGDRPASAPPHEQAASRLP